MNGSHVAGIDMRTQKLDNDAFPVEPVGPKHLPVVERRRVTNDAGRLDEARSALPLPTESDPATEPFSIPGRFTMATSVAFMSIPIDDLLHQDSGQDDVRVLSLPPCAMIQSQHGQSLNSMPHDLQKIIWIL
jgi:hypothetical protein